MKNIAYICSPFSAKTKEQFDLQYEHTKEASREVVLGGYEVIVPHLYYPQFLDDDSTHERLVGTQSALKLLDVCDLMFVSIKQKVSKGMKAEIELAEQKSMKIYWFRNMNELRDILKKAKS